jgi:hypothetical protein
MYIGVALTADGPHMYLCRYKSGYSWTPLKELAEKFPSKKIASTVTEDYLLNGMDVFYIEDVFCGPSL